MYISHLPHLEIYKYWSINTTYIGLNNIRIQVLPLGNTSNENNIL